MSDPFASNFAALGRPAFRAEPITTSDTVALTDIPQGIYVGTGGTIVMRGENDTADRTWKNIPAGSIVPFRAAYIRATGTTAADMLALY